jgi:monoamine oxidase
MRSLYARLDQRFGTRLPAIERQRDAQNRVDRLEERFETRVLFASPKPKKQCSIIIIGAGFAGLIAGSVLSRFCRVTVFEARDRLGGRVWTQVNAATHRAIEAGAELVGYNHPTWISLAKRFDLGFTVLTSDEAFTYLNLETPLYLDGRLLSSKEAEHVYDEMKPIISNLCVQAGKLADPYKPWGMPNADKLDSMNLSDWIQKQKCSPLAKKALEVQFANTNGVAARKQSYLANLAAIRGGALDGKPDDYFTQSETMKCEQGNDMLARKLAEDIEREGGAIIKSSPVADIDVRDDRILATPAGGEPVEADYAVLAIPPSLWPSKAPSDIKINPPICQDFHMSMGSAIKYLSEMKTRFWFAEGLSPNSVSETIGMTWEGTDNQLQIGGQPVELSLFAGGRAADAAIEMFERSGMQGLSAFYTREMDKLYPGYSRDRAESKFVCWPRDRWTRAGYSCPAPGEVTRIGPFLSRPFQGRLFFAGEHCCPPFFGYMEGALQSGLAAASAILRNEGWI